MLCFFCVVTCNFLNFGMIFTVNKKIYKNYNLDYYKINVIMLIL